MSDARILRDPLAGLEEIQSHPACGFDVVLSEAQISRMSAAASGESLKRFTPALLS
jgi:hypothetical protein